ncbi:hypothetical protein [Methylobacterium sp. A54F]
MILLFSLTITLTAVMLASARRTRAARVRALIFEAVEALAPYATGVEIEIWILERTGKLISIEEIGAVLRVLVDEGLVGFAGGSTLSEIGVWRAGYVLPKRGAE